LELIRESLAMSEYSSSFNTLSLPFDRILVAVVVSSHSTLRKCAILLHEIETTPLETLFPTKEARKKRYRRIFRVSMELWEILMTVYDKRSSILQDSLTMESFLAFQSSLESQVFPKNETETKAFSQKELSVRGLLASEWVTQFECGLAMTASYANEYTTSKSLIKDSALTRDLLVDSKEIDCSFQRSLDSSFEEYLEKQRKWAETGAVRDLEFEGDTILKKLSKRREIGSALKQYSLTSSAADLRLKLVDAQIGYLWKPPILHWMLAKHTDPLGRVCQL